MAPSRGRQSIEPVHSSLAGLHASTTNDAAVELDAAEHVDTVVIGSGPSALLLSFILHGHHPYVRQSSAHPDPQLQAKLAQISSLFDADPSQLSAHFPASRLSYSTQALSYNTLLDTLIRPLGDTAPGLHETCIEWRQSTEKVSHVVIGAETAAGGQWQAECGNASRDIGALSYADLISLPEYSLEKHLVQKGQNLPEAGFVRPSREDVAGYFADWPHKVGIMSALRLGRAVTQVRRLEGGSSLNENNNSNTPTNPDLVHGTTTGSLFHIAPHNIICRRLILATGIFTHRIPPRPLLQPLLQLRPLESTTKNLPLLLIGSGFSAADLILTYLPRGQKILHLFQWDYVSEKNRSPLRACHPAAYPEYASVFRRMKRAAQTAAELKQNSSHTVAGVRPDWKRRKSSATGTDRPEWDELYEGFPNARIHAVHVCEDGESAMIILERPGGGLMERAVCGLEYVIGRRGSLDFLAPELRTQVLGKDAEAGQISNKSLRDKAEERQHLEMAPNVFAVGSLLGDSLIRHAYGGCVVVAAEVIRRIRAGESGGGVGDEAQMSVRKVSNEEKHSNAVPGAALVNGHRGHEGRPFADIDGHIMPLWKHVNPQEPQELKMEEGCAV